MPEFWLESGYRLLDQTADGELKVTDDFLRAYLLRPELEPVDESCEKERGLHEELLVDPTQEITPNTLEEIADSDVKDNYRVFLYFRNLLLSAGTLENCYVTLFRIENNQTPPLFINQLVQIILRNILDQTSDALMVRSSELLFREQKVSLNNEMLLSADAEIVSLMSENSGFGSLGQLVVEAGAKLESTEMDILGIDNQETYWERSNNFDMAIRLNTPGESVNALCRVLELWILHFFKLEVSIQTMNEINDDKWLWHIGLDAQSTTILNELYEGSSLDEHQLRQLLVLFRMEVKDKGLLKSELEGAPIYLAMAMDGENRLRLKPQNLIVNLPLAEHV